MHAAGRSPKEVKEQLGHSTIAMTLDTYTHLFDEGRDEAAEAMAEHFRSSL
jgi:integrase